MWFQITRNPFLKYILYSDLCSDDKKITFGPPESKIDSQNKTNQTAFHNMATKLIKLHKVNQEVFPLWKRGQNKKK